MLPGSITCHDGHDHTRPGNDHMRAYGDHMRDCDEHMRALMKIGGHVMVI